MSHRLLLSSIQLSPKASEYKPGAPPPYPSSIQYSWSPALLNSFSEASNTSLKKSIYSPCPSTRCKVYDVWLRTELHKQLLRKWVEGWMKDEWMKEGLKITVGKSLPSEIPSWQHGSQQQTDHGGFRNDPLSPIPLPAFVRFPASFCPQWGPCVFLLSVFFLPPDGAVSSILKALGVCRLLFLVLLYTMRIFMFNKWVPKVPRSTNVNGMCWTNSLKYYSSKMKK